jgi:hypothetical protein
MQISTEEQKKAILAVLECSDAAFDSQEEALLAASSAIASALGNDAIESLQIAELQEMDFVEMHASTVGGRQRVKWRLTDSARAQLDSEKRVCFDSEVQALGSSPSSIVFIEPLWLSDRNLVRFSLGDSAPRERMREYIRENLKIMRRAKAGG